MRARPPISVVLGYDRCDRSELGAEAPDLETHLRASAELTRRLSEAHAGPNPFVLHCDAHKDNLYPRTLP